MPFPVVDRVIYAKNPLASVVCQVRFPTILTIEAEPPAKFQEEVRQAFPLYKQSGDSMRLPLPEGFDQLVPHELRQALTMHGNRRYLFQSDDRNWTLSLTGESMALEVKHYRRWEEFRQYLKMATAALVGVYAPAHFSRVGLRYQNIINRAELGLGQFEWRNLLTSFVLGPLGNDELSSRVVEKHGAFSVRLEDEGDFVRILHGLEIDEANEDSSEKYLLDNDFFTSQNLSAEVQHVANKTNSFNSLNRSLFRSCIKERLHMAMGPEGI